MKLSAKAKTALYLVCCASVEAAGKDADELSAGYGELLAEFRRLTNMDASTAEQFVGTVSSQYISLAAAVVMKDVLLEQPSGREHRAFVDFCERMFGMIRGEAALKLLSLTKQLKKGI